MDNPLCFRSHLLGCFNPCQELQPLSQYESYSLDKLQSGHLHLLIFALRLGLRPHSTTNIPTPFSFPVGGLCIYIYLVIFAFFLIYGVRS